MFLLAGIPHLSTLITPLLSGLLMQHKIWIPFAVSITAYLLGLLVVALTPETFRHDAVTKNPRLAPADSPNDTEEDDRRPPSYEQLPRDIHDRTLRLEVPTKVWWRDLVNLLHMPGLPFCYTLYFFKPVAMISKVFVYQYASYNFHWKLRRTTWLRISQAGGSTLATLAVLPVLLSILRRSGPEAKRLDLNVIRISLLISAIGFVLLQFSFRGWMLLFGNTSKIHALFLRLTSCSTVHMRSKRGRRTSFARLHDLPHRSHLPREIIHLSSCCGDSSKADRRTNNG